MAEPPMHPIDHPVVTDALLSALVAQADEDGPKPHAFETPLRYSSAGGCSMRLALDALRVPSSDPMDPAGRWVTWLGTLVHEHLQGALVKRFPSAECEPATFLPLSADPPLISGHADAFIPAATLQAVIEGWSLGSALYELKTMGAFGFDKSIGVIRKNFKNPRTTPEGPKRNAVIQAGFSARAKGATTLIVGHIGMEALSKNLAERAGMSQLGRVMAEWIVTRDVWEPMVEDELARMQRIVDGIERGVLPERIVREDGRTKLLDPTATNPPWNCLYCAYLGTCRQIGTGSTDGLPIPVSLGRSS